MAASDEEGTMAATPDDERYDKARQKVEAKMGFFTHLFTFVVINVIFLIVAGEDWLWVTLFWGLGLAIHAFYTFFGDSDAVTSWKERQIQKEMGRGQAKPEPAPTESLPAEPPPAPAPEDPTVT
jgi:2TM domain